MGRKADLKRLDNAWADPKTHILVIVAWGGVGKTSLIVEWMARQAKAKWRGFERVFDWSFYNQGTTEKSADSSKQFIAAALEFFGGVDGKEMANSNASPWDKGARLAQYVRQTRSLLVLDGLEPLQKSNPVAGQLLDDALTCLLRGLAQDNDGLCIVTTRIGIPDLDPWKDKTIFYHGKREDITGEYPQLSRLSIEAGTELLKSLGVKGVKAEFEQLVNDVKGHALTLNLLGRYLSKAHQGDIRRRDQVDFEKADAEVQGGHAFKAMAAYEKWLANSNNGGVRSITMLWLMGLFDRPAEPCCLTALCKPTISGLTESLSALEEADFSLLISDLEETGLVKLLPFEQKRVKGLTKDQAEKWLKSRGEVPSVHSQRDEPEEFPVLHEFGLPIKHTLDVHPLLRDYFGKRLKEISRSHLLSKTLNVPSLWCECNYRLYKHLKDSVPYWPDGTAGHDPLFRAVIHGCQAEAHREAFNEVYWARIVRSRRSLHDRPTGASSEHLRCLRLFFEQWPSVPKREFSDEEKALLMDDAAHYLFVLGHLTDGAAAMKQAVTQRTKRGEWVDAAINARLLREMYLLMGMPEAEFWAKESVRLAELSKDLHQRLSEHSGLGQVLHYQGRTEEANTVFKTVQNIVATEGGQLDYRLGIVGFWYAEFLVDHNVLSKADSLAGDMLNNARRFGWGMDAGHAHLINGRVILAEAREESASWKSNAGEHFNKAVELMRSSGQQHHLANALIERSRYYHRCGNHHLSSQDLDEAWLIAVRSSLRLYMADIHLTRASLFHVVEPYPWSEELVLKGRGKTHRSPKDDLAAAEQIINECNYRRRAQELEETKKMIHNNS
ncbi:MAG: hypothetical protein WCO56_15600 [Verrucomicrobiota bacterium]